MSGTKLKFEFWPEVLERNSNSTCCEIARSSSVYWNNQFFAIDVMTTGTNTRKNNNNENILHSSMNHSYGFSVQFWFCSDETRIPNLSERIVNLSKSQFCPRLISLCSMCERQNAWWVWQLFPSLIVSSEISLVGVFRLILASHNWVS
jgi:hypothetical protein